MAIALVLVSVVVYGFWGMLGKVALRHLAWPQVSMFYGIAILVVVASRSQYRTAHPAGLVTGPGSRP
jgi:hypothetical protein